MTTSISVRGIDAPQIAASADAILRREELLSLSRAITSVNSEHELRDATTLLNDMSRFLREVEGARAEAKRPALDIGRRIDEIGKELSSMVDEAKRRIAGVAGAYQERQRLLEAERVRKAREEEDRIRREADEKLRRDREEAEAKARELEAKAARARSAERSVALANEAALVRDAGAAKAEATIERTTEAIVAARTSVAPVVGARVEGTQLRRELTFTVKDIQALYDAAPYLVSLTPNNAAIRSALRNLQAGQKLPGVEHSWRPVTIA